MSTGSQTSNDPTKPIESPKSTVVNTADTIVNIAEKLTDKVVMTKLEQFKQISELFSKQGIAVIIAIFTIIYVIIPHGEAVQKLGDAIGKIAQSSETSAKSSEGTTKAVESTTKAVEAIQRVIEQQQPIITELKESNAVNRDMTQTHIRLTEEIRDDVTDIHKVLIKPNGTRPK